MRLLGYGERIPVGVKFVFLVVLRDGEIVAVKTKKRGWDVPGGHVEKGENPLNAIIRESREEAGIEFFELPIHFLLVPYSHSMEALGFVPGKYYLPDEHTPAADVEERRVMPIDRFLEVYQGDKKQAYEIIIMAE